MYKPQKCGDCEFWVKYDRKYNGVTRGECRGDFPYMRHDGYGDWPLTNEDDFCYRGQPKNWLLAESKNDTPKEPVDNSIL